MNAKTSAQIFALAILLSALMCLAWTVPVGAQPAPSSQAINVEQELIDVERAYAPGSKELATALLRLSKRLESVGRFREAIAVAQRVIEVQTRLYGSEHLEVAGSLNHLAVLYLNSGQYAQAQPLFQRGLAIQENALGPNHVNVGTSLNNLAVLHRATGQYEKALPLAQRSLTIYEQALGPDHAYVASILNNLATLYVSTGQFAQALPLLQRSLAINEKALGPNHEAVANDLNNLAVLYSNMGQYAQALPLLQRSLAISEKSLGPEHMAVSNGLINLAELYRTMGQYAPALPLCQRSLAIAERVLGPDHVQVAARLNNLAALLSDMGQNAQALPLYQRSLAINEKALGPNHVAVATSLNNVAHLYDITGQYAQALPLLQRSLVIYERALGPDHVQVATSLSNLGSLYHTTGQYANALPLYQRSLAIREKALGYDHADLANSLNHLAVLYVTTGQYAQALPLFQRSLGVRERALGPNHLNVAESLNNLAELYGNMGQYALALALHQRSLALREKGLGPDDTGVATSLGNLAAMYHTMGQYADALPLYMRSLAIREKALGPDHMDVANSLNNLAELYRRTGHFAQALPLYQRSLAIAEGNLGPDHKTVATLLSNQGTLHASAGDSGQALTLYQRSIAVAYSNPGARETLWNALASVAAVHEAQGDIEAAIFWGKLAVNTLQGLRAELGKSDRELANGYLESRKWVYARLISLLLSQERFAEAELVMQMQRERELYEDVTRGANGKPSETQVSLGPDEQRKKDELERNTLQYAQRLAEYRRLNERLSQLTPPERARLAELSKLLTGLNEGLLRFWSTLSVELKPRYERDKPADARGAQTKLQAIVNEATRPGGAGGPVVALQYVVTPKRITIVVTASALDLPLRVEQKISDDELRTLVNRFREALSNPLGDMKAVTTDGQKLYGLLLEPVLPTLRRLRPQTVMLWTNDILRRVPFAALFDGTRYVVEEDFVVVHFNDLATVLDGSGHGGSRVRMAAFGFSQPVPGPPPLKALQNVPAEVRGVSSNWPGSGRWLDTLAEGAETDGPFTLKTFGRALEQARAGQYQLLHVASHFVMEAGYPHRSRLYLGDKSELTISEIENLGLRFEGLDLVTLSACSTAVELRLNSNDQEMQSLSSMLIRKGAKATMATMWDVETVSMQKLVERFYEGLKAGRNKAEALKDAQMALLKPSGAAAKTPPANADWRHPYYWAPMVLTGEWR